jgi:hypothetical protein
VRPAEVELLEVAGEAAGSSSSSSCKHIAESSSSTSLRAVL